MMKFVISAIALLMASGMEAQEQWTLGRCIDYAVDHSISVKRQQLSVESGKVALSTSKNSYLPNLQASAGADFNFGRGLTIDNTYANRNTSSTSFSMNTSVPLFTGGQIENDIKSKRLELQASLADLERVKENVSVQVTSAYLEALFQKDLLTVAKEQAELSKIQEKRVEALYRNGKSSETELAEIRATVANDELSVTQQDNSYRIALLDLSQLLELPSPEGFDIVTPQQEDASSVVLVNPEIIYSEAVVGKPQIQAEKYRLESAMKNIKVAKSALYPSLHFGAGIGTNYYKTSGFEAASFNSQMRDNLNKSIGISLSYTIFNRFHTRNQIRNARLQAENQRLQLDETKKALYKEIQQAYYNAVAAQKQCESSAIAEKASETSFDLMTKKYANGKATVTEYQESKTALMKAQSNRIQAQYTFLFRRKILDFYRGVKLR